MNKPDSKNQILKTIGILGSTQVIIIVVGIIRVKILAVLLGAVGVGLAGLYQATIELVRAVTGLGLGYSAVREIAASAATNDEKRIAATVVVLRQWVWVTGLVGMLVTIAFSKQLSYLAFGDTSHALNISILSVVLVLTSLSTGEAAMLQGFRRIGELAKANVLGAIIGLLGATLIYYFWGLKGIVPAILLTYILVLLLNWYFSRKIKIIEVKLRPAEIFFKGRDMAKLGFFMSLTGLASTGTLYLVRSFVSQEGGLASVGHFVAAWSISSMYISAIFGAMGTDFFPRLSAVQNDSVEIAKMVNEQTELALLITAPIIIGMVSFIDLVVLIFYSKDFGPTASILDWQLFGDFFKVLGWPMGFILLAKGKGNLYIFTELSWNLFFLAGVYFGWAYLGLEITGAAFLGSYFLYALLQIIVNKNLIQFKWSSRVKKYVLVFLPLLIISFLSVKFLEQIPQLIICGTSTILALIFSGKNLKDIIDIKSVLKRLKILK